MEILDDLRTLEGLRGAWERIAAGDPAVDRPAWLLEYEQLLRDVQLASRAERATIEFHERLWRKNPLPASPHEVDFADAAIGDAEFRAWFAERSMEPLPPGLETRWTFFERFMRDLATRLRPHFRLVSRTRLRRGLAILYPEALSAQVLKKPLRRAAAALGLNPKAVPLRLSLLIADRLEQALGPVGEEGGDSLALRSALLYLLPIPNPEGTREEIPEDDDGPERALEPLPAIRRRKGLTSMKGNFVTMLSILEFVSHEVTREELLDFLRSEAPDLKDSSLGIRINVLQSEFDVIRKSGGEYILSPRGEALLETQDPSELADWLLTRTLGPDFVVKRLGAGGPLPTAEVVEGLQRMNPGWTTTYAPLSIIGWLRSLGVVESAEGGLTRLTERGQQWAKLVLWEPEPLQRDEAEEDDQHVPDLRHAKVQLPPVGAVVERIAQLGHFPPGFVTELHTGLWAHERRHFAVLTGLSGSGKTLLARSYAEALSGGADKGSQHLCTIAVQPGWYDPAALLGYVNPLRADAYVRTEFLEFLLHATTLPHQPFVAVLDEMNLSHPEQYMAPLLSAMETGADIHLHSEGGLFDGIPARVPYPPNLVLIGTVNMDETTHGLSDKVLDRAFTLEFWQIDLDLYPRWKANGLEAGRIEEVRALLGELMTALSPARLHFGWRVVDEVLDFLVRNQDDGAALDFGAALDAIVHAKILPKLRGEDSTRFRSSLEDCDGILQRHGLSRSRQKIEALRHDLDSTGSARFWR